MDEYRPDQRTVARPKSIKYSVVCKCGHQMRVKPRHLGRMCRCTKCNFPIYVTRENVTPPMRTPSKSDRRFFSESEVPVHWRNGDLLMETYEVKARLGEGGMGVVHRVFHRGWGIDLAVKSPRSVLLENPRWIEQFEHECETWINLGPHPNSVECFYVRSLGGIPRVFVEFVSGKDLGYCIASKYLYIGGRDMALKRILDAAIQFAWGLSHAHKEGILHQDVKPNNVLISDDGHAKVTDFGMARVMPLMGTGSDRASSSRVGPTGGTPAYRSPEHEDPERICVQSDVWSWALSMLHMLAGKLYWDEGKDATQHLDKLIVSGPSVKEVPLMPRELGALLYSCFDDRPENRPQNMLEIAAALKGFFLEVAGVPYPRNDPISFTTTTDTMNNRAVSAVDLGKSADSEKMWADILEEEPNHFEANFNSNLFAWRRGRITDVELMVKLYEVCANHPDGWLPPYVLARVLMERGDYRNAMSVLEGVHESGPYKRDVAFALAMAQNHLERDMHLIWEPDSREPTSALTMSFDGWRVVSATGQGTIKLWDVSLRECTRVLEGHERPVYSLCLSEEETLLLSASGDHTLKVWNPNTGKCLRTLTGHSDVVRSAVLTSNAKQAISASHDGTIKVWDVTTGECLKTLEGHTAMVMSVALSRDGNLAVSGSRDLTIKIWDLHSSKCIRTLGGNDSPVRSVNLSGDRSRIVASSGKEVKIWDAASGGLIKSFRGHTTEIHALRLSDNGRYAVSATKSGTVKIWDVATGQCLRSLRGHSPIFLSKDAGSLVAGGAKRQFKVWAVHISEPPFAAPYQIARATENVPVAEPHQVESPDPGE